MEATSLCLLGEGQLGQERSSQPGPRKPMERGLGQYRNPRALAERSFHNAVLQSLLPFYR